MLNEKIQELAERKENLLGEINFLKGSLDEHKKDIKDMERIIKISTQMIYPAYYESIRNSTAKTLEICKENLERYNKEMVLYIEEVKEVETKLRKLEKLQKQISEI